MVRSISNYTQPLPFCQADNGTFEIIRREVPQKTKGDVTMKKPLGRPQKLDYRIMMKLADSIQHNSTITEACRFSGISRDTFYRYMKSQPVFAEKIATAKENQNKVPMSFLTIY